MHMERYLIMYFNEHLYLFTGKQECPDDAASKNDTQAVMIRMTFFSLLEIKICMHYHKKMKIKVQV